MDARRSFSSLVAAVLLCASVAVIATPSTAVAGGGSVPGGNCGDPPSTSTDFCSYFQADVGPPFIHSTFFITCPVEVTSHGAYTPQFIENIDIYANAYVFNTGDQVPVTPVGHSANGADSTLWSNDVLIPELPGYPGVIVGYGSCAYEYNPQLQDGSKYWYQTEPIPQNYFWVEKPNQFGFKIFKQYLYLSWEAMFGSARVFGDEAFRAPLLNVQPVIGPPDTTTTTTTRPSTASTSTTSTTRTQPTTTTSTTRGRG